MNFIQNLTAQHEKSIAPLLYKYTGNEIPVNIDTVKAAAIKYGEPFIMDVYLASNFDGKATNLPEIEIKAQRSGGFNWDTFKDKFIENVPFIQSAISVGKSVIEKPKTPEPPKPVATENNTKIIVIIVGALAVLGLAYYLITKK